MEFSGGGEGGNDYYDGNDVDNDDDSYNVDHRDDDDKDNDDDDYDGWVVGWEVHRWALRGMFNASQDQQTKKTVLCFQFIFALQKL